MCHASPWALLRPDGYVRRAPCMAYLTGTLIDHDGEAYAARGYTMHPSMEGEWSKHPRRIEWSDIAARWPSQPSAAAVRQSIARRPTQRRQGGQQ